MYLDASRRATLRKPTREDLLVKTKIRNIAPLVKIALQIDRGIKTNAPFWDASVFFFLIFFDVSSRSS